MDVMDGISEAVMLESEDYEVPEEDRELLDNIDEYLSAKSDRGSRYIQMLLAAYCEKTKLPPEKVCLVHWKRNGKSVWQYISEEEAYDLLNGDDDEEDIVTDYSP